MLTCEWRLASSSNLVAPGKDGMPTLVYLRAIPCQFSKFGNKLSILIIMYSYEQLKYLLKKFFFAFWWALI